MKHCRFNIFAVVLLISGLLFSQVGINFFHNRHDAHKTTVELPKGEFGIHTHGEHCKVCAIDLLHHLIAPEENLQQERAPEIFQNGFFQTNEPFIVISLQQGRAPPLIS